MFLNGFNCTYIRDLSNFYECNPLNKRMDYFEDDLNGIAEFMFYKSNRL